MTVSRALAPFFLLQHVKQVMLPEQSNEPFGPTGEVVLVQLPCHPGLALTDGGGLQTPLQTGWKPMHTTGMAYSFS